MAATALRPLWPLGLLAASAIFVLLMTTMLLGAQIESEACGGGAEGGFVEPSATALADIPGNYLKLYVSAAAEYELGPEGWSYLAAIGWRETNDGRYQAEGVTSGANSAGAAGPMGIGIGGAAGDTWASYGVDGDHDGKKDVYDPADAIPAAAHILKAAGAPGDWPAAIFSYNHASWYVEEVTSKAATYRRAAQEQPQSVDVADTGAELTPVSFAEALLTMLRIQPTGQAVLDVVAWEEAEGGNWKNAAKYNPLNTSQPEPGSHGGNPGMPAFIQSYTSWRSGIQATYDNLTGQLAAQYGYDAIVEDLRQGASLQQFEQAVLASSWGTVKFTGTGQNYEPEGGPATEEAEACPASGPVTGPTIPGTVAKIDPHTGVASIPQNAPPAVQHLIAAGNEIITKPYPEPEDTHYGSPPGNVGGPLWPAYDCSAATAFVLFHAGLLGTAPTSNWVSGDFDSWGEPGPGQWITTYSNAGHVFIEVAGIVLNTAWYAPVEPTTPSTGPRWQPLSTVAEQQEGDAYGGFTARHPKGY
jgi:hypothetical protein